MPTQLDRLIDHADPRTLNRSQQLGLLGLLAFVALPGAAPNIIVLKATTALFFAVFVMSWDFVSGYTGQISFGHALFFGVGGYTSALLNVYFGWSPLLTILFGGLLAALAGIIVGVPALRLQGPYLALLTLIAPLILLRFIIMFAPWTGGETGLVGASKTPEGSFGAANLVDGIIPNYYFALVVFLLALAVFMAITRSDAGEIFTAIREDEDAVSSAGLNPAKFKVFAFVLSATVGGLAGAAFIHTPQGTVSPAQILSVVLSIEVIIATVLGGTSTITGAAFGGLFFFFLREQLRQVDVVIPAINTAVSEFDLLIFSLITLGFLFFMPQGMLPWLIHRGRKLTSELGGGGGESEVVTDGGVPREPVVTAQRLDRPGRRHRPAEGAGTTSDSHRTGPPPGDQSPGPNHPSRTETGPPEASPGQGAVRTGGETE